MSIPYVIKQADIDRATANGVSLRSGSGYVLAVGDTVAIGSTIRAVAGSGKKFTTTTSPTTSSIYFSRQSTSTGSVSYAPWTISADGKTASFVLADVANINYTGIYSNTVSDIPVCYTVKAADINDATTSKIYFTINGINAKSGDNIYSGDVVVFEIYAGIDKWFFTWGADHTACNFYAVASGVEQFLDGVMSSDRRKLTVTMKTPKEANPTSPYTTWGGVSMDSQDTTGYIFTDSDYQNLVDNHATLKANGVNVVAGTLISFGDNLIATADSGWQFDKTSVNPYSSIYFKLRGQSGGISYKGFTVSDDGKTASLTFTKEKYARYISLITGTSQKTEVIGTNNVYSITPAILTELNNKRFVIEGNPPQLVDYGQYILSVLQLPFALDSSLILEPENIQLANINIGVAAPVVNTDILTVDLGSITIVGENQNMLDYANTTAILYLPYCQPVNIDLEHVIDQTISIVYNVDCYTGIANVLISSTSTNDVIINQNVDLGINIPMANNRTTKAVDNSNISVGGDNGIKTPFITIVRNESVLKDGFFTIPVIDESDLSSASGYIRVEDVNLIGDTMLTEKESIISKLKSGVIVK
ncbi:hypothetical protein ACU04M_005174 [Escherichia coli]